MYKSYSIKLNSVAIAKWEEIKKRQKYKDIQGFVEKAIEEKYKN